MGYVFFVNDTAYFMFPLVIFVHIYILFLEILINIITKVYHYCTINMILKLF